MTDSTPKACSYFISDLHLSADKPQITALLQHFLREIAPNGEALYILGDLFAYWIGDDDPNPLHREVAGALHSLSQKGVKIYYQHGNRDFMIGKRYAAEAGFTLLPDPYAVELYGEPLLLMHGDLLCTKDLGYLKFRERTQIAWLRWVFLRLPLFVRQRIAAKMRAGSSTKPLEVMDVTPEAITEALSAARATTLIHGHTHKPDLHQINATQRRLVLGDWGDDGSYLTFDEAHHAQLHRFTLPEAG